MLQPKWVCLLLGLRLDNLATAMTFSPDTFGSVLKFDPTLAPTLIVGGLCDSGTRGVKTLVEAMGLRMCRIVNDSEDNMYTASILSNVEHSIIAMLYNGHGEFSVRSYRKSPRAFYHVAHWLAGRTLKTRGCVDPNTSKRLQWGFKNPQQSLIFPVSEYLFENRTKLLLVVRDPRDICTARNQRMFDTFCSSILGRVCDSTDCYSFWAKLHKNMLSAYSDSGIVKAVRIESLVSPISPGTVVRQTAECISSFAGLQPDENKIGSVLNTMSEHRDAYMGHHYGQTSRDRDELVNATRNHHDPLVGDVMKQFGYSPDEFMLIKPSAGIVC